MLGISENKKNKVLQTLRKNNFKILNIKFNDDDDLFNENQIEINNLIDNTNKIKENQNKIKDKKIIDNNNLNDNKNKCIKIKSNKTINQTIKQQKQIKHIKK